MGWSESPVGLLLRGDAGGGPGNRADLKDVGLNHREHMDVINLL